MIQPSEQPPSYFPLDSGRYEVKTGLYALGTDFGNGEADEKIFQIDAGFRHYREAKLAARGERLSKYHCTHRYSLRLGNTVACFIAHRLSQEHPSYFALEETQDGAILRCILTEELLSFDSNMKLIEARSKDRPVSPGYVSSLDALASQIQEDVAVITLSVDHWLSAIHLCYPNHWAAEHKIAKDFASIHKPVPGIEKINERTSALVDAMIYKGPYVRFAWGLSTDSRLNHHPEPPPGVSPSAWQGRYFNQADPKLFLRVERQTLWGFPDEAGALFTIHTYFTDCREIKKDPDRLRKLESAIESMTPETLAYKGFADSKVNILAWLREIAQAI